MRRYGPGWVMRRITDAFDTFPWREFSVNDFCDICYPHDKPHEKKHFVTIIRAGKAVCRMSPYWMWFYRGRKIYFKRR